MKASLDRARTSFTIIGLSVFCCLTTAAADPAFRPALIGNGPESLVNLIDVAKLLREAQGDAVVMFENPVFAGPLKMDLGTVYRATPGSKPLQKEILRALSRATFIPAIADGKPVRVYFRGTIMFFANSSPHLRIFANQDPGELAHMSEFIAPQLIVGSTRWNPKDENLEAARRLNQNGAVVLSLHVDEKGKLRSIKVISEDPRTLHFGAAVTESFRTAQFVPGFRNGKPVDCTFQMTEYVVIERVFRFGAY
jgi:TonB family protein